MGSPYSDNRLGVTAKATMININLLWWKENNIYKLDMTMENMWKAHSRVGK